MVKSMAIDTSFLSGHDRHDAHASQNILSMCHQFKVSRIHTTAHSAEMIWLKPSRDWTYQILIGHAMRVANLATGPDIAVAALVTGTRPEPAGLGFLDAIPEGNRLRASASTHQSQVVLTSVATIRLASSGFQVIRCVPLLPCWERAMIVCVSPEC
jgi:hypothetical protein